MNEQRWEQVVDDLQNMLNLEDDWNGIGATAPSAELVDSALQLAKIFAIMNWKPPSSTVASPDGTILFVWQLGHTYLDMEIIQPHHAECMWAVPGQLK